jgi:hypothetical protein
MQEVRKYRLQMSDIFLAHDRFREKMEMYRRELSVLGDHPTQASFVAALLECSEKEVSEA